MTKATIPESLQRVGIVAVSDNVPDGHRVAAPTLPLLTLFRQELLSELEKRRRQRTEAES